MAVFFWTKQKKKEIKRKVVLSNPLIYLRLNCFMNWNFIYILKFKYNFKTVKNYNFFKGGTNWLYYI